MVSVDADSFADSPDLFCTRTDAKAIGIRTSDGFVVKKGSLISSKLTKSCPEHIIKKREQYKDQIDAEYKLLEDILFNTPSGAAAFVCGSSANGNVEWKNADGVTLKEIEENTEE